MVTYIRAKADRQILCQKVVPTNQFDKLRVIDDVQGRRFPTMAIGTEDSETTHAGLREASSVSEYSMIIHSPYRCSGLELKMCEGIKA